MLWIQTLSDSKMEESKYKQQKGGSDLGFSSDYLKLGFQYLCLSRVGSQSVNPVLSQRPFILLLSTAYGEKFSHDL